MAGASQADRAPGDPSSGSSRSQQHHGNRPVRCNSAGGALVPGGIAAHRSSRRQRDRARHCSVLAQVPLIYVQSLGNRDGRPTFSRQELQTMGYAGCIEAQFALLYAFTTMRKALQALAADGRYDAMDQAEYVAARQAIEDIIGLDESRSFAPSPTWTTQTRPRAFLRSPNCA
jgi:hypothetical protein